jgi:hypothetical protein
MDPAIFIEAEEARLSQCVEDARESVIEVASRLARQREIVDELERAGHHTTAARRQLATLAAAQQSNEKLYRSCLQRLNRASADC